RHPPEATSASTGEEPRDRAAALVADGADLDAVARAVDDDEAAARGEGGLVARPGERRREVVGSGEEQGRHRRQPGAARRGGRRWRGGPGEALADEAVPARGGAVERAELHRAQPRDGADEQRGSAGGGR